MTVRFDDRVLATTQVLCVATVGLLIALDAATVWAIPVVALFLSAVMLGEQAGNDAAVDEHIVALTEDRESPDLGVAVGLAVVLYLAVLSGLVLVLVAETCSALAVPFLVAAAAFGTLRLHVAAAPTAR